MMPSQKTFLPLLLSSISLLALPCGTFAVGTAPLAPNGDIIPNSISFSSTQIAGPFNGAQAADNLVTAANAPADNGLLFFGSDTFDAGAGINAQRFALTGFIGKVDVLWLYTITTDTLRVPASVTIRSSTSAQTSLNPGDYETPLVSSFSLGLAAFSNPPLVVDPIGDPARNDVRYAIVPVNAPVGTQSLFFDFDNDFVVGGNGTRLQELQAFTVVPEPSTTALCLGALPLLGFLLRRRKP